MLTREAANCIVGLLSNESDSLTSLVSRFTESFDARNRMVALTGMALLVSDGLLDHRQQIVAVWLLYSEFSGIPLVDNPFQPLFATLYDFRRSDPHSCAPQLYEILACILSSAPLDEIAVASVKTVLGPTFVIAPSRLATVTIPKLENVRISRVLTETNSESHGTTTQSEILVELLCGPSLYSSYEAPFIRPAPAVSPVFPDELSDAFVSSFDAAPALFDECVSINSREVAISMIWKAADGKLKPAEVESLSRELTKNPNLAIEAKLPHERIEAMIDATPAIAKDMFRILAMGDSHLIDFLAHTHISENLIDIAQAVLTHSCLPENVISDYINGQIACIQSSRDAQTPRKIAMFCKFLCSVIKDGLKLEGDLLMDLYSFCVEPRNGSIKEAKELVELLALD